MSKPYFPKQNKERDDPVIQSIQQDYTINKQYNIEAIKMNGVDNLPQRWKKLSPINRFKDKLKAEKEKIRELNRLK